MDFIRASISYIGSATLRSLLAAAMFEPTEAKIDKFLSGVRPDSIHLAGKDGAILGQMTVAREGTLATIRSISCLPKGAGTGRFLVASYIDANPGTILEAETDDGAVGFYHALGFKIESLGEKYSGAVRYRCVYDEASFDPKPYAEAVAAFSGAGVRCWVAGGWALDLHRGYQSRPHEDTDIAILRMDQGTLRDVFRGWEVYRTHAPGLALWDGKTVLDTVPNVWLRKNRESSWNLEIMFVDVEDGQWVYRRNRAIHGSLDSMGLETRDGIPYLRPEIQLLYKGGSSRPRKKDFADLVSTLPLLGQVEVDWLESSLETQFPGGHEWLLFIRERKVALACPPSPLGL